MKSIKELEVEIEKKRGMYSRAVSLHRQSRYRFFQDIAILRAELKQTKDVIELIDEMINNYKTMVEKAIEESKKGKMIVMLLKVDTSTRWFAKIHESKAQILWINGRLRYRKDSYKRFDNTPVTWASMLVIFNALNRSNVSSEVRE